MIIDKNVIIFKSSPAFFEKEKSGVKNNTVRCLLQEEEEQLWDTVTQFNISSFIIKIVNTESGECFCRNVRDISLSENRYIFTWDEKPEA